MIKITFSKAGIRFLLLLTISAPNIIFSGTSQAITPNNIGNLVEPANSASTVKAVLKFIAEHPSSLELLKDHPDRFGQKYRLSQQETEALKSADNFLIAESCDGSCTFETGSTITGGSYCTGYCTFETGSTITGGY